MMKYSLFTTLEEAEQFLSTQTQETSTSTTSSTPVPPKATKKSKKKKTKKPAPPSKFAWPFKPDLRKPKINVSAHCISPSGLQASPQLASIGITVDPFTIAQKVVENIKLGEDGIIDARAVAPGFVQISYGKKILEAIALSILKNGVQPPLSIQQDVKTPIDPSRKKKMIVVDFSSPNIAKEMHVGHLRSTIIGESICRILEFCGYEVDRVNHIGDWGTQFGMLIVHLMDVSKQQSADGTVDLIKNPPQIADLQTFYTEAKKRFDAEPDFKKSSQDQVVKLQSGEEKSIHAWKLICEISAVEYNLIYDRLNVTIRDQGESFYNDIIPKVNQILTKIPNPIRPGHMLAELNEKALCVFTTPPPPPETLETSTSTSAKKKKKKKKGSKPAIPPLMIQKTDGGFSYDSTDIAAVWHRFVQQKADRVVYVVGGEQAMHFQSVFKAARLAGWITDKHQIDHAGFGMVCGSNGKKFSTREGGVVKLKSLLDEAVTRFQVHLNAKEAERKSKFDQGIEHGYVPKTAEELADISKAMGYSAVKYFDLKHSRERNYIFDYHKMLDTRGDTAVYINYSYARMCQIKRKVLLKHEIDLPETAWGGAFIDSIVSTTQLSIDHPSERNLMAYISTLDSIIEDVVANLIPHRLCEFAYELCQRVSSFYRDCRVVGDPQELSRLLMIEVAIKTLCRVLELLGITPLHKV